MERGVVGVIGFIIVVILAIRLNADSWKEAWEAIVVLLALSSIVGIIALVIYYNG
jgi:hypothetical protein